MFVGIAFVGIAYVLLTLAVIGWIVDAVRISPVPSDPRTKATA